MDRRRDSWTTKADDEAVQAAMLRQLFDLHPARLTIAELIRELAGERPGFAERDAVERAMRDLEATGLLHRGDDFVTPSRAALRLSESLDH
ncbi:MAG TPA: hypothetical protein VNB59_02225 [Solirubrobacterales bacterium]|jgi:hypothetical protein|nr:hypothetical protein [Solirubrobacterales bacterium]